MPMESRISCPLCGDILPVPENAQGTTCPHCGAHIPRPGGETVPTAISMCGEPPAAASTMTVPTITSAPSPPADTPQSAPTPRAGKLKTFFIAAACAVGMIGLIVLGIATVPSSPTSAPDTAAPSPSSSATTSAVTSATAPTTTINTASPPVTRQALMDKTVNLLAAFVGKSRYEAGRNLEFRLLKESPESDGSGTAYYNLLDNGNTLCFIAYKCKNNGDVWSCVATRSIPSSAEDDLFTSILIARAAVLPLFNHYMGTSCSLKEFTEKIAAEAQRTEDMSGYLLRTHNCTVTERLANNSFSTVVISSH